MRQKVLLIDDSPVLAQLVTARLGDEPIELHCAPDGPAGIELARNLHPDLILLDVDMPGMDGFEVCRRLKLDNDLLAIPIVFLSGSAASADKILGLELGAVDYISKPFDTAELKARVRAALRLKRMSDLLSAKARIDSVTGLWNEAFFDARLASEVNLTDRSGRPVSVVLCDIDNYRKHNATHGPWFGDQMLLAVADILSRSARQEDVVCRVSGATLGVICPSSPVQGAMVLANRLRSQISALRFSPRGTEIRLTASFGVAGTEQGISVAQRDVAADAPVAVIPGQIRAAMLRQAGGQALAAAKSGGKDRIVVADASMWPAMPESLGSTEFAPRVERRGVSSAGDSATEIGSRAA